MGHVALAAHRVDVLELRPRVLGVLREVEVAPVRDSLELRPADREEVLEVGRAARVVRELVLAVHALPQPALSQAIAGVPPEPLVDPVAIPLVSFCRWDEVLHLHLLELACAEEEVPRSDLVPERLADLRDSERRLSAGDLEDVLEVDEDALCGLRAKKRLRARLLDRADPRLEHEVELARFREIALGGLARVLARFASARGLAQLVGAEAQLARAAVDERIAEALDMAGGLPDARV